MNPRAHGPQNTIVLQLIDAVVNGRELSRIEELLHPDFFDHDAPASRSCGPAGFRSTVRALHASYAGFRLEPRDVIAADGKVVVRATASGRQLEGCGREWSAQQIHIFRLAQGRVIEHWASSDGPATARAAEPHCLEAAKRGATSSSAIGQGLPHESTRAPPGGYKPLPPSSAGKAAE